MVDVQIRTATDGPSSSFPPGYGPGIALLVSGAVDRAGGRTLRTLLDTLVATTCPVTVDLYEASATDGGLVRILCQFRRERRDRGLPVRFVGLHGGNLPDPDGLPLRELFMVYEQEREANTAGLVDAA